ncbi:GNAT family N-acetyltransferase [uncultured Anaerococcus sp.]|uniref:GNAT family N-acetyltransferase n=1 Tax=uncultured Anaerococcus sp. TaxID=293428 RepID=UPI002638D89E|nr:GNAT family N-acetyltransferase [uncultured Anaerococcus sp.]
MQVKIKSFDELTKQELYEILRLRVDIFVVEQECPYLEIDGKDYEAIHIYLENKGEIQAYARVYKEEGEVHIGRVISKERRKGHATLILKEAIRVAEENYQARKIVIEAQTYAKSLYAKVGFVEDSEIYLLDGIEHIKMVLQIK